MNERGFFRKAAKVVAHIFPTGQFHQPDSLRGSTTTSKVEASRRFRGKITPKTGSRYYK